MAAFQPEAVAKVVKTPAKLDAIEPNTYIKLTFLPTETVDHTYEELPVVSPSTHSPLPSVSTFKLTTKPDQKPASIRPAIQISAISTSDMDDYIYNKAEESPTSETSTFTIIKSSSESSYQQQSFSLPGKRMEPRSYSPVPSPPIIVSAVRVGLPHPALLQKAINRAPMPLPKPSGNADSRPTSDVPSDDPPRNPYGSSKTVDRAPSDGSRSDGYRKTESPKAIRSEQQQRKEHPVVPLPPVLKPSDFQRVLKPVYKSFDLGMNPTCLDDQETPKSDERNPPRKPKPQKPRSKTDVSLSTSTLRLLQQEKIQQDIKASEPSCEIPGSTSLPLPKYPTKPNKTPFSKTRATSPDIGQGIADPDTSLPDYDEILATESNVKIPQKVKIPPPLLPRSDSKLSLPDNEAVRPASPKLPLPPPPPKFCPPEYECPSKDSNTPLSTSEPNVPKLPQLNYEKLPTKDQKDTIESIADIPEKLDNLSCFHLADCLKLLNMESYIKTFLSNQIDGKLLLELDEEILTSDLKVSKLHAKKLFMFAHRGWRP